MRLLDELTDATAAFLKIAGQKEIADLQQDSSPVNRLEPLVLAASERREKARLAIRDHAETHRMGQ